MNDIGDNHKLTDAQEQALFVDWLGKIEKQKAIIASETATVRNMYKAAKVEGFTKKDIDFAIRLKKHEDDDIRAEMKQQAKIARWMRIPIGVTPDLFDEPDRETLDEKAHNDGRVVGMAGGDRTSPYDPTSTNDQNWLIGYDEGQQALRDAFVARQEAATETSDPDEGDGGELDDLDDAGDESQD